MKHYLDILKKKKLMIAIYILLGIVVALLNAFSASYFQKVLDDFGDKTLSITTICIYGFVLVTVITIAHRLGTIKNVDKIYVFKDGEIVGVGDFKELLDHNQYFGQLWNATIKN